MAWSGRPPGRARPAQCRPPPQVHKPQRYGWFEPLVPLPAGSAHAVTQRPTPASETGDADPRTSPLLVDDPTTIVDCCGCLEATNVADLAHSPPCSARSPRS